MIYNNSERGFNNDELAHLLITLIFKFSFALGKYFKIS